MSDLHTDYGYGIGDMGSEGGTKGKASSIIGPRKEEDMEEEESLSHCCPSSAAPFWERPREKSQGEERIEGKETTFLEEGGRKGKRKRTAHDDFPRPWGRNCHRGLLSFRKLFESQKWNRECYYFSSKMKGVLPSPIAGWRRNGSPSLIPEREAKPICNGIKERRK